MRHFLIIFFRDEKKIGIYNFQVFGRTVRFWGKMKLYLESGVKSKMTHRNRIYQQSSDQKIGFVNLLTLTGIFWPKMKT